jgi:hypothetical protein
MSEPTLTPPDAGAPALVEKIGGLDRRTERIVALILICVSLSFILPHTRYTAWGSANTKSRMATVEALVHHGTYAIDASPYNKTMDRVKIDGKLYSSKPPMLPTLIAGAYYVLHKTTGMSFAGKGRAKRFSSVHATLSVMFSGTALVVYLLCLYLAACLLVRDPFARLLALATGAFGFFGAGYAVDINNHVPAAALGMLAVVLTLDIVRRERSEGETPTVWHFVGVGLALGFLPTVDIPSAVMSIGLGGWLLLAARKRALTIALPVSLVPIVAHMWMTYSYSGGVLPVQMNASAWERKPSGPRINRFVYFFHSTFGLRGIFSMVPMLVPAGLGMWASIKQKRSLARPLAFILLGVLVLQAQFYLRRNNYGGVCVGSRWFIPIIAWSLVYVAVFAEQLREGRHHRLWWIAIPIMLLWGGVHLGSAASNPWSTSAFEQVFTKRFRLKDSEDYGELRGKSNKKDKKDKKTGKSKQDRSTRGKDTRSPTKAEGQQGIASPAAEARPVRLQPVGPVRRPPAPAPTAPRPDGGR